MLDFYSKWCYNYIIRLKGVNMKRLNELKQQGDVKGTKCTMFRKVLLSEDTIHNNIENNEIITIKDVEITERYIIVHSFLTEPNLEKWIKMAQLLGCKTNAQWIR